MGNSDGIGSALLSQGTNQVINFDGGYFSFAFGNEIALVITDKPGFYILNCDVDLSNEVQKAFDAESSVTEAIEFWVEKEKSYEVSDWSADFDQLSDLV